MFPLMSLKEDAPRCRFQRIEGIVFNKFLVDHVYRPPARVDRTPRSPVSVRKQAQYRETMGCGSYAASR